MRPTAGLRMLMLDVRNAIARILDRYVLGDVVDITLRKMRRDGVTIPFMVEKLLGPSAPVDGAPSFVEHFPLGGFLAELEGARTDGKVKAAAKQAAKGKPAGKK
ncbi:MAG: hypothetical protein WDN28_18630 [Chthoniobacter sp.]